MQQQNETDLTTYVLDIDLDAVLGKPTKKDAPTRKLEENSTQKIKAAAYEGNYQPYLQQIELEKKLDALLNSRLPDLFNAFLVSPYIAPNGKNNGALRAVTIANQLQIVNVLRHLITVIAYKPVMRNREDYYHFRAQLIKQLSLIMALKCFKNTRADIHAFIMSIVRDFLRTAKQFVISVNGVKQDAV